MYLLDIEFNWGDGPMGYIKGALFIGIGWWIMYRLATSRQEKSTPVDPPQRTVDPDEDKNLGFYDDEHNY